MLADLQLWLSQVEEIVLRGAALALLLTFAARLILGEVGSLLRSREIRWLRSAAAKVLEYLGNVDVSGSRRPKP